MKKQTKFSIAKKETYYDEGNVIKELTHAKGIRVDNTEPNTITEVSHPSVTNWRGNYETKDWAEISPSHISPTVKNCRIAARFPTVSGIIHNLIVKILSSFKITGEDEESEEVKHILECDKIWDLNNLCYEVLWNNFTDGEAFYEYIIKDNHVKLRGLAFDGDEYRIKKIYDEFGDVEGYVQLTKKNTNKENWRTADYNDLQEDLEPVTIPFELDEVTNPIMIKINGEGYSLVKNVINLAFYLNNLYEQMPPVIHKSSNTAIVTVGNENRREVVLNEKRRDEIAENVSDYNKKGVVVLPYGVDVKLIGNHLIPDIPAFVKSVKASIYEGLVTPESLYSSESSNRSTAEVQLTDTRTGHVLFIEYCQEFLKKFIERELFDRELKLHNMKEGSVWIDFNPLEEELGLPYMEGNNLDIKQILEKKILENEEIPKIQ